jgi:histidinol-phosphate phosphatase family protein
LNRPAAFLDRDGTIIADPGYLKDPAEVRILDGAIAAIRDLRSRGMAIVVVTNQSGIARGFLSWDDYHAVADRVAHLLGDAAPDATFACPHYPAVTGPCDCRKPGLKHYLDAAAQLGLNLARSTWIGDRITDLTPATAFGGRGILVRTGVGLDHETEARADGFEVADDLGAAALLVPGPGTKPLGLY